MPQERNLVGLTCSRTGFSKSIINPAFGAVSSSCVKTRCKHGRPMGILEEFMKADPELHTGEESLAGMIMSAGVRAEHCKLITLANYRLWL